MNFPKKQNILFFNLSKAYVEGVYNDSPLNRKLGRVGMSYKEYERMLKERGEYEETHANKKEKNEIPINVSDLNFDKNGKASYEANGNKIEVSLISHEKYGEKIFTLKINDKEYKNLNTTQLIRRLKAIAENKDFTDSEERMSDMIPLNTEDFLDKYGDIGFNYTYYKDDLDIKVWIREDSNKKDPHFNIYVIDSKTKKKKSFTNLSLLETHNKLLEYDLNPDIEKPLSKQQLRELNRIKKEKGILKKNENEPSKDIGIDFDESGNAKFKIDGGFCELQVSKTNPSLIDVFVINNKGEIEGIDSINVDNFNNLMSNYDIELKDENQVYEVSDSDGNPIVSFIKKPLKDIVENYSDKYTLYPLVTWRNQNEGYIPTEEDENKLKKQIFNKKLGKFKNSSKDWNKDIREAYVFANSPAFINWLKDMPESNKGISKRQIYKEVKELSDRFSSSGNIKGIYDISSLKSHIINEYY